MCFSVDWFCVVLCPYCCGTFGGDGCECVCIRGWRHQVCRGAGMTSALPAFCRLCLALVEQKIRNFMCTQGPYGHCHPRATQYIFQPGAAAPNLSLCRHTAGILYLHPCNYIVRVAFFLPVCVGETPSVLFCEGLRRRELFVESRKSVRRGAAGQTACLSSGEAL